MPTALTETFKQINKRFEHVEEPIFENLEEIIGEERLKSLKRYLNSKRKAIIKGIPPRDAIGRAIDSFFDTFEEGRDIETIKNFCDDTSDNYVKLQAELYDLINNFIDLAQDENLIDMRDLDQVSLKIKGGKKVLFTEPLAQEDQYISPRKDKGSPDLVSRAKAMAKVLNEELAQPFRSQANQVSLTEKLDSLCQYILAKNQDIPEMEKVRNNLQQLELLLAEIMETKTINPKSLEKIDKIIDYNEKTVSIEATNQVEEGLGGFTIEGKPASLEELIPEGTKLEPVNKPRNINVEPSKMKFKPEQAQALEDVLLTLVGVEGDIRNDKGYIDLEKTKAGKINLRPKDVKKINKIIGEFRDAFQIIGGQMLPESLARKKAAERVAIIDELLDIFTKKGIKGKTKSIGVAIDDLIKSGTHPFSKEFVEVFNQVKQLDNASGIPELYQKGLLIPKRQVNTLEELKEAIELFNCDNPEHAKETLLNIGTATENLEDKGIKDKKALESLGNAFRNFMKFDVDVQKLVKKNKMTEGDFFKLLDDISDVCYNPALQTVKPEISEIPEDFDLEAFIKSEFTKVKRKKERTKEQKANKRKALADLINDIWEETGIKDSLTPYEKIKFQFGVTETEPKEMIEYINMLLNEQRPKLTPEKITEQGISKEFKGRPDPHKMKNLKGNKSTKEAIWIDTDTGQEFHRKFKTDKGLSNFLARMAKANPSLTPVVSRKENKAKGKPATKEVKKSLKNLIPSKKRGRGRPRKNKSKSEEQT